MSAALIAHIAAGGVALLAGFVALTTSGRPAVHRKAGTVFTYAMVLLGVTAATLGITTGKYGNVAGGGFVIYLVVTAVWTMRSTRSHDSAGSIRSADTALAGIALVFAVYGIARAIVSTMPSLAAADDVPTPARVVFAVVALLALTGDVRVVRGGSLHGPPRLRRHLWRMCVAMFIAAGSFVAQPRVITAVRPLPLPVRIAVRTLAVVPLVVMAYYLFRHRGRRRARHIGGGAMLSGDSAVALDPAATRRRSGLPS